MGNHAIAKPVGLGAEKLLRAREEGKVTLSALEILDILCEPWRGCDAEFSHYRLPQFDLGKLMIEAFSPNGLADLPKYLEAEWDEEIDDLWWEEVCKPFSDRYDFC